jgi:hypothetical protein
VAQSAQTNQAADGIFLHRPLTVMHAAAQFFVAALLSGLYCVRGQTDHDTYTEILAKYQHFVIFIAE